ncbi:hypothetical protein FOL47_009645, partial [Perkinsus chesapeaki]
MFASPNPKFIASGRERSSGSSGLGASQNAAELSPRMKKGIEAAVKRARLAREKRLSLRGPRPLALSPPVRKRPTTRGVPIVSAPPSRSQGPVPGFTYQPKREVMSSVSIGEEEEQARPTPAPTMTPQSVTRQLDSPGVVCRMERWIDEIRAELIQVESELTEQRASATVAERAAAIPQATAPASPRVEEGSLISPRLRGGGGGGGTVSGGHSGRSTPALSGASPSVVAEVPASPRSGRSVASAPKSSPKASPVTAVERMKSEETVLVNNTPMDSPCTVVPTLPEDTKVTTVLTTTREKLEGMVKDIRDIERSAFSLRFAMNRMISEHSAILNSTSRSVMSAQSSPRIRMVTPRLEDRPPQSARASIAHTPSINNMLPASVYVNRRGPPPISRGTFSRVGQSSCRVTNYPPVKLPTCRDICSAVHRGMKPWDIDLLPRSSYVNHTQQETGPCRGQSGGIRMPTTTPPTGSRMHSLSEKLNRIRQQRKALDELTNKQLPVVSRATPGVRDTNEATGASGYLSRSPMVKNTGSRLSRGWTDTMRTKEQDDRVQQSISFENDDEPEMGLRCSRVRLDTLEDGGSCEVTARRRQKEAGKITSDANLSGADEDLDDRQQQGDGELRSTYPAKRGGEREWADWSLPQLPTVAATVAKKSQSRRSLGDSWQRESRGADVPRRIEEVSPLVEDEEPDRNLREVPMDLGEEYGNDREYYGEDRMSYDDPYGGRSYRSEGESSDGVGEKGLYYGEVQEISDEDEEEEGY